MVSHWSLSDRKSPQVSRTRLSILAVLSNAVVWIVSTRPPTSKSSRPFNNPLVTVPNAPITIGIIVTFIIIIIISSSSSFSFESFSDQRKLMVSHWSLSYSKSPQVFGTLLSILADLNNEVVWMVSTRSILISLPVTLPILWGLF